MSDPALSGLGVIDCSRALAGPNCTMLLVDYTNPEREAAPVELIPLLQKLFRNRNTADWIHLLLRENIPVRPLNDIPTVLNAPQVQTRQMVQEVEHQSAGTIRLVGPVAKLSATPAEILIAPPPLGI